ncbi:HAD family hydrolase [Micromonospora sp. NPDC005686]|uniref:HAD family hydrolase n=1 Tax=unclassified Micromonospora TaxID=2617518 RepID=UPI0033B1F0F3
MTAPVEAVVFDMDGTLIESHEVVPAAYRAAVRAGGGPEYTDAEVIAGYSLGSPIDLLSHLLRRPATDGDLAGYHAELSRIAGQVCVYPGVTQMLTELAARVPVGLFTGGSHVAAGIMLDRVGILDRFGVVLGGDQVSRPKPAPDGVELACRRLGVPPSRAAYVGDSPLDLRAARAAGTTAVAAAWGHQYDPAEPADLTLSHPAQVLSLLPDSLPPRGPLG